MAVPAVIRPQKTPTAPQTLTSVVGGREGVSCTTRPGGPDRALSDAVGTVQLASVVWTTQSHIPRIDACAQARRTTERPAAAWAVKTAAHDLGLLPLRPMTTRGRAEARPATPPS